MVPRFARAYVLQDATAKAYVCYSTLQILWNRVTADRC